MQPARPSTSSSPSNSSATGFVIALVVGAFGIGGVVLLCGVGGFFMLMRSNDRVSTVGSTYVPPPATPEVESAAATLSGRGDALRARFEVHTAPGSVVTFHGGRSGSWPAEREVVADDTGVAVYEPEGVPTFEGRRESKMVTVAVRHPEGRGVGRGRINVTRPPHLSCTGSCECRGGPTCSFRFDGLERVRVEAPPGSRVTVAGETRTLTADSAEFPIEPVAIEGEVLERIFGRADIAERTYPIRIELPGGESFSEEMRLMSSGLRSLVSHMLGEALEGHAVPVPGEGRGGSIVLFERGMRLFGEPRSLADIRYVAEITETTRDAACGGYQNARTGAVVRVRRHYTDGRVQLFDRRTGRRGPSTTIRAPSRSCPRSVSGGRRVSSSFDQSDAIAWLERRAR